ncbi:MAG: peptidoglycan DD-metalloendopeptidase family protein [Caldilineaceae bacterium]
MSFQTAIRTRFLQRPTDLPSNELLDGVEQYGVVFRPAKVAKGDRFWRVAGIHHLEPAENRGGHSVYVDAVDENGQRIEDPNLRIRWGWEGQRADEASPPQKLDKRAPEPAGNVVLFLPQHTWVEIEGLGLSSDRVANLHTNHADEPAPGGELWNSRGHHSFYVLFQAVRSSTASSDFDSEPSDSHKDKSDSPTDEQELDIITFGPFSNQDLINAVALTAAALLLADPWSLLVRAGSSLEELAARRTGRYTGPPIHELPNLSIQERNVLMQRLRDVLATMPTPPRSDESSSDRAPSGQSVEESDGEAPPDEEPSPTKEPTAADDLRVATGGNRLGFYLHTSVDQDGLWNAINRVRPPAILIHADTANRMLLQEIRAWRAPDAFVIGRLFKDVNAQRQMLEGPDPAAAGRSMAEEILSYDFGLATQRGDNGRLLIDAWISLNEPVPGPASQQFAEQPQETARLLRAYDQFQIAFHARLQEAGVEAVAFNFGAGNFSRPEHYLDYFPQTLASYTYLGFHEYGWPSLDPATGAATAAGLYRSSMNGIRERFGERHRAIITEAGLTRMYKDAAAGDVGWLNSESPLSEDAYWRSLEWYNKFLGQDPYVLGACLFEVGHHGGWETFRHLGRDNLGNVLGLVDRIADLSPKESIAAVESAAEHGTNETTEVAAEPASSPVTIRGSVRSGSMPLAGATVRLLGGQDTLGGVAGAAAYAPSSAQWTRKESGFEGDLANVWRSLLADGSVPLTWQQFREQALQYNPSLRRSSAQLASNAEYYLPENADYIPAVIWDRPLSQFSGTIRACWYRYVARKVVGMTYADFKREVVRHNPSLNTSGMRFESGRRYMLPRTEGQKEYVLEDKTATRGRFLFKNLPSGTYRLEVQGEGHLPQTLTFDTDDVQTLTIELQPVGAADNALPAFAGTDDSFETATPSESRDGFVRTQGSEFVAGGQALRFIGVNVRGLVHYGDGTTLPHTTLEHRREQIRAARDIGARVIRVFLPNVKISPLETVERLRDLIVLLKEEAPGVYLLPSLSNLYSDVPFRVPGDDGFYARVDPNFPIDLLNADFFEGGYQSHYLPFLQQIVQAFRDEPVIFAWEVGNELKLNPVGGDFEVDPHIQAFLDFMHATARQIRRLDPNHLVTTGMISTHHAWLQSDLLRDRLYANDSFDFLTVHCYNDELENDDSAVAARLDKPFIIEEAGYGRGFGGDRSGKVAEDMARWFSRGARGYMPWGFMATNQDIGDGDGDSGLDRTLHGDWEQITGLLRRRADELLQEAEAIVVNPAPVKQPQTDFAQGQTVFSLDWVNVRRSPGHAGKLGDDILGMLAPGAPAEVTGASFAKDGLTWWPLHGALSSGEMVDGWAAAAVGDVTLLSSEPLAESAASAQESVQGGADAPSLETERQTLFAQSYVNLRHDPGYIGKPADHVIGQIPYGAQVTVLGDAVDADGLTWFPVRAPLLDNQVATGWAAEGDPSGTLLLATEPPAPPAPVNGAVHGPPFHIDETLTVLNSANIRSQAGFATVPAPQVLATLARDARLTAQEGPSSVDDLEWWRGLSQEDATLAGWVATCAPDGTRLVVTESVARALEALGTIPSFGPLTQGWGANPAFYQQFCYDGVPLKGHNGLDYGIPEGTPITAIGDARIARIGFEPDGFGNFILLEHEWGESLYAHLSRVDVAANGQVARGETIALSGNTGASTGPHLHFGIRVYPYRRTDGWGGFVNPLLLLPEPESLSGHVRPRRPSPMGPELPGRLRP